MRYPQSMWKKLWVYFPMRQIKEIDKLIATKGYCNRNEVIRMAVRDLIKNEGKWHI